MHRGGQVSPQSMHTQQNNEEKKMEIESKKAEFSRLKAELDKIKDDRAKQ